MAKNYSNESEQIGKLLGALCVIVALIGGCWFLAYRVYTTTPATETITVTLPPGVMAGDVILVESPWSQVSNTPQVVEIVREKPWRDDFSALLHPLGFMILLLLIVGAGGGVIWLAVWGGNYG